MEDKELTWKEVRESLNFTQEEEEEIELEKEIILATIEARKKKNISQRELSIKTGIKQPAIARIEQGRHSPTTSTLIKLLVPLGYTLSIVPLRKKENKEGKRK